MPRPPDLALDRLLASPDTGLFAVGSFGDQLCCLLSLDVDPLDIRWSQDLGEEATGCQIERVGEALWVFGLLDRPILRFSAATGAPLPPLQAPGLQEVLEVAADTDGTALLSGEPHFDLIRVDAQASQLPLWPRPNFARRMLLGRGGGHVFNVPIPRPTGLIPPARLGSGADGALRLAGAGCVARLEPDGHLSWVARLPEAIAPLSPPRAAPDGTTWALFTRGEGDIGLYRIQADGSDATLKETGWFTDLAVGSGGEVFLLGGGSLQRISPDGARARLWETLSTPESSG